ncbi:MAG: sigma-54-dependent Fis family transcriptional regulator [Deltaproteobacteria bacterium]|nr:sigma-54-dependent Fis family transcriptional regulator [Deltaproteobacteria bacterium]
MRSKKPANEFRVLVVDDESTFARSLAKRLNRMGMKTSTASTGAQALSMSVIRSYDLVLLDQRLPDANGVDLVPVLLRNLPNCRVVMMTAYEAISSAVEAMRHGAEDYLVKSTSLDPLVEKTIEVRSRWMLGSGRSGLGEFGHPLTGKSSAIKHAMAQLQEVAMAPKTTVLLLGESGTGKEVAARFLHVSSGGHKADFIPVDCIALPNELAESHLFGHEKGSFTGAVSSHSGYFEAAGDGTIFLDEIGDMPFNLQGKLLRCLENRTFRRLGSTRELPVNARVVAATHQNLAKLVEQGKFRHDLYHRLAVFPVHLPPLRERKEDLPLLADEFISLFNQRLGKQVSPIPDTVTSLLENYDFPGNVRELKNLIEQAMVKTRGTVLEPEHFPDRVRNDGPTFEAIPVESRITGNTLGQVEKNMILDALKKAGGNRTKAAKLLGITRYALLRRIQKFDLSE